MNQREDFIIPECYIDTNLVETLVCTGGCNHQKGCNTVAKVMQDKFGDSGFSRWGWNGCRRKALSMQS